MDLERCPLASFDYNYLVCQLAAVAMNLLPHDWAKHAQNEPDAACSGHVLPKRGRIKTVMPDDVQGRSHDQALPGRWFLGLGRMTAVFCSVERHSRSSEQT